MHLRRDEDRLAGNCPSPSTEVQPGKTKFLNNPSMLELIRYLCPTSYQSKSPSHVFWNNIFGIIVTGVISSRGSKTRPKLPAINWRVIIGVRMPSGKANELLSIKVDEFLCVFLLFLAQFS